MLWFLISFLAGFQWSCDEGCGLVVVPWASLMKVFEWHCCPTSVIGCGLPCWFNYTIRTYLSFFV